LPATGGKLSFVLCSNLYFAGLEFAPSSDETGLLSPIKCGGGRDTVACLVPSANAS